MKNKTIRCSSHSPDSVSIATAQRVLKKGGAAILAAAGLVMGMLFVQSCSKAKAGPNGGDIVSLDDGKTSAELVANADTGEVMMHTWDNDLKSVRPIESLPLTIGSDQGQVQLEPHPLASDPQGYCSRFYGRADWLRGGAVHHGWVSRSASQLQRHHFDWNRCWKAGGAHGRMWSEMGGHRAGMGHGGMRQ